MAGIDIGVDNLMAIAFTSGHHPVLIKGNEIKAVNQFYNKQIAHYRSLLRIGKKDSKGIHQTKRMKRISEKRNRRVKDILHKASRKIIDLCVEEGIEVIVVGIMQVGRSVSIWGRRTIRPLCRYRFVR